MMRTNNETKYFKLKYFLDNNLNVHIVLQSGFFRNGKILDLNNEKAFVILRDDVLGEAPIMFEEISDYDNAISERKKVVGK